MQVPEGETREFLGEEFLTWLWYYGERNDWTMTFSDNKQISYGMDELLVLKPEDLNGCAQRLSGPVPSRSPEAYVGLRDGKKVAATRFIIVYEEREWTVTLRAEKFYFSSLKLMQPTTTDAEDRFAELVEDLEQIVEIFDHIYNMFVEIRLTPAWEKELVAIQDWVTHRE